MEQVKNNTIIKELFGQTTEGNKVDLFTLTNSNGIIIKITNYGGIITSIVIPDKNGDRGDIVLGFDNLNSYLDKHPYFGAIVGRYANRIAKGKFILDGKSYSLAINNGENHLHGGLKGFDKKIWDVEEISQPEGLGLKLSYISKDEEEGYPGNLLITVTYILTNNNELIMDYEATTDKTTPINITNHSYFNLSAGKSQSCLDHEIRLNAEKYVEVNEQLIPTGNFKDVTNTPMDFTESHSIGKYLDQTNGGYDHTFIITHPNESDDKLAFVGSAHDPVSDRMLELYTTQPGVQFYTGNFLDGSLEGKEKIKYGKHSGFCLETHHFPDSPNQTSFPSVWLHPGEKFHEKTVIKFSIFNPTETQKIGKSVYHLNT